MEKPHSPVDLEREKLTGNGTKAFEDVEAVVPKVRSSVKTLLVLLLSVNRLCYSMTALENEKVTILRGVSLA